ncbi:MAG: hypothetical protein WBD20_12760 [Pirellulaceae bacterium]
MQSFKLLVGCFSVLLASCVCGQDNNLVKSLPAFLDPLSDLAAVELSHGRLRLNPNHWVETVYPISGGDPMLQLLADTTIAIDRDYLAQSDVEEQRFFLRTYAAEKLLTRIRQAIAPRGYGGGSSSGGARMHFHATDYTASFNAEPFSVAANSTGHFSFNQYGGERLHLWIDDNSNNFFRLEYGDQQRFGQLTQSSDGHLRFVNVAAANPVAVSWPSYAALMADNGLVKAKLIEELAVMHFEFPSPPQSELLVQSTDDTHEGDRFGALDHLQRQLKDLVPIQLGDGRLMIDRSHWTRAAETPIATTPAAEASPIDSDPFGAKRLRRQSRRQQTPLQKLVTRLADTIHSNGSSGSQTSGMSIQTVRSDKFSAKFMTDREHDRLKMSFVENTSTARCITVEELPDERFLVSYCDPNRSIVLKQNGIGSVSAVFCSAQQQSSKQWESYQDMIRGDDLAFQAWTQWAAPLGIVLPQPPK